MVRRMFFTAIAIGVCACSDNSTPTPTAPTPPGPAPPPPPAPSITRSVSGTVYDPVFPLANARVEIVNGSPPGTTAVTGADGRYELRVTGAVEIRASLEGFQSQLLLISATGGPGHNFRLDPLEIANIGGEWRFTIEASPSCNGLPDAARRARTYRAVLTQTGARLDGQLRDSLEADYPVLWGRTDTRTMRLVLGCPWVEVCAIQALDSGDVVAVFAETELIVSPTRMSGTMAGRFEIQSRPYGPATHSCAATDHRITIDR